MTNEELLEDLKQYIDTRASQQDARWDQKFDEKLAPIKKQISDLSEQVSQAIDTSNESADTQLADHETRITKLEKAVA